MTTTNTTKKKTGRGGRPKGSANREYVDVVVIPPKCPKCSRAVDTTKGKKFRQVKYAHKSPDGTLSNVIKWYRTQCVCGQFIAYRKHEYDEDAE